MVEFLRLLILVRRTQQTCGNKINTLCKKLFTENMSEVSGSTNGSTHDLVLVLRIGMNQREWVLGHSVLSMMILSMRRVALENTLMQTWKS